MEASRVIGEDASFGIGALSSDGRTLTAWDNSENVIVWDVTSGCPTETFEGHARDAGIQVFSPDGRTLYTAGDDSRVIIWDVAGDRRLGRPFRTGFDYETETGQRVPAPRHDQPRRASARRREARWQGGPVRRRDLAPDRGLRGIRRQSRRSRRVRARRASPRGSGNARRRRRWERRPGGASARSCTPLVERRRTTRTPSRRSPSVAGVARGRGNRGRRAGLGRRRRKLAGPPLRLPPSVLGLAFSPDGSRLAIPFGAVLAKGGDGVEVPREKRPTSRQAARRRRGPCGPLLPRRRPARGGELDGAAVLWATEGWRRVGRRWLCARRRPWRSTSPRTAARLRARTPTARSYSGMPVAGADRLAPALPGSPREVYTTARFTPDGNRLFAVHEDGRAFRWGVDPGAWASSLRRRRSRPHSQQWENCARAGLSRLPLG